MSSASLAGHARTYNLRQLDHFQSPRQGADFNANTYINDTTDFLV
jgi:hypothetical protein